MAAVAILNFENGWPFHYYLTNRHQIWWECWEYDKERKCWIEFAYLPEFKMRPPPFWISKIGCHFVTIKPILTKLGGNVENLQTMQLSYRKCIVNKIKDGGRHHLEFRISVAISLLLDQSSPNLVGMLRIWQRTQLLYTVNKRCNYYFYYKNAYLPELKMAAPPSLIAKKMLPFLHY